MRRKLSKKLMLPQTKFHLKFNNENRIHPVINWFLRNYTHQIYSKATVRWQLPSLFSHPMIRHAVPLVKWSTADPFDLIGSFLVANTNGLIPNTPSWTGWRQADEKHHFRHLNRSQKKNICLPHSKRSCNYGGGPPRDPWPGSSW